MSAINVMNVMVLDNPSMFLNPLQFDISYECLVPLKDGQLFLLIFTSLMLVLAFRPGGQKQSSKSKLHNCEWVET